MLSMNLSENIKTAREIFTIGKSFDYIEREILLGVTPAYILTLNGFTETDVLQWIISDLQNDAYTSNNRIEDYRTYVKAKIGYAQVEFVSDWDRIVKMVLSGTCLILFDGFEEGILLDTRSYPTRGTQEPDTEKVTRGAKDGFVENFLVNTTLIRRRIRSPKLTFQISELGTDSKSDVVIAYIEGCAEESLVREVKTKLQSLQVTGLTMGMKTLEELLVKKTVFHPLPSVHLTERPDVACSFLEEGHIVLIADNSPTAMILPVSVFQFSQSPEDYYKSPLVGNYIRLIRFLCIMGSLLILPLLLLFGIHVPLPEAFSPFITPNQGPIKLFVLILVIEIALDLFRYSAAHTSDRFAGTVSIVGGLIIGEIAIGLEWASEEALFYGAVTMLLSLAIPSLEFAEGIRMYRLFLSVVTGLFGLPGFAAGLLLILISVATTPTFPRTSYLWPLFPLRLSLLWPLLCRRATYRAQPIKKNRKNK